MSTQQEAPGQDARTRTIVEMTVIDPEVERQALSWPAKVDQMKVVDEATYAALGEMKVGITQLKKKIEADEKPNIDLWTQGLDKAREHRDWLVKPLKSAIEMAGTKLKAYLDKKEADRLGLERETNRRNAEDAKAKRDREALEAVSAGNVAKAEEIIQRPVEVPHVSISAPRPKVAGLKPRENWSAEVTDLAELICWAADAIRAVTQLPEGPQLRQPYLEALLPNMVELNRRARLLKADLRIPGVKAKVETVL